MFGGNPLRKEHRFARWTVRVVVLTVLVGLLVAVFSGVAAAWPTPVQVGSAATGNQPYSVCVQGGYAYMVNSSSNTLQVFDVSNPASPSLAGSVGTGNQPYSVCVQGDYAYVANFSSNTLQVFNVSNPASPSLAGSTATGNSPESVCVQGGYAYVTNYNSNTMQVFNVSNPASPSLAGSTATGNSPRSVSIQGGYAYVVNTNSNTLQVFAVSNPASPSLAGSVATGGFPTSVCVQGGYAYVLNQFNGLQVCDVSNPASPTFVSWTDVGNTPFSVCVQGGYAYVVNGGSFPTLQVFNVSNPASPSSVGSVATGINPLSVSVQGGYAYVVNYNSNTLQVFNVSNPASPSLVGSAGTGTNPFSVCVQGGYAYVVNANSNTLQVFDVSNPASPSLAGSAATGSTPRSVCVQGVYAYVVNANGNTLQVFDVSNPASPTSAGSAATGSYPSSVYVQGNYAYVTNYIGNTLQVFNVSNPASPSSTGSVATGGYSLSVCVQGGYAYVTSWGNSTMQVFNVSNPASPTSAGSAATGTDPWSVCIQGRYAYVVNHGSNTLQVFNVSNPASPSLSGSVGTGNAPNSVCVQGGYAYVANGGSNTLQVFNVSNPASPSLSGSTATGNAPNSVYVQGGYAYVGNWGSDTLQVFLLWSTTAPAVTTTAPTNIASTTADSGGNVADDGGATVTSRGVCWSTDPNPTVSDSHTTDGSGTGVFTSNITGLSPHTGYHMRAYATNSAGTSYGDDAPFITYSTTPTVTTTAPTNITSTTADSGGNVTTDGGDSVTARGVCWSTNPNPTTSDSHTTDGTGTGIFTSNITGLSPHTGYHMRAYATNSAGTSYGDDAPFITYSTTPTVTTTAPSSITSTTASSGGNVTADGGASITHRGVCWSTLPNPTTADSKTDDGAGTGTFTSNITGLSPGTPYHVRAYATNSVGTSYGSDISFMTLTAPTITYIVPNTGPNTGPIHITDLRGTDFGGGVLLSPGFGIPTTPPTVKLKKAGQADITATNVVVSLVTEQYGTSGIALGNKITCDFDLTGAAPGKWDVFVMNPDEQSATLAQGFTIIQPVTKPEVTSVNPPTGQEGQTVTVTGSNFGATQGSSTITIGGMPASVVSWSDTKIVVTVPAGASSGAVIVTTSQGGSNTNKIFTLVYPTWYLAEGTTAWGFSTYITIENPNPSAVTAKITYMDPNPVSGKGRVFPPRTITLPAMSQTTVDPRWDLGNTDFSTRVDCLQGKTIAVDRTMFWTGPGAPSPEGHNSVGTSSPAKTWYLPEGSSAWNFETWTLVENPNATDAHVTLTYMVQGGGPRTLAKTVPAYSRATYNMASDLGEQADASVKLVSDAPVIVEQSMYRDNRREGSCSIGANTPSTDYYLAEGTTAWGFDTYVLVENPNPTPTDVTITCMTPTGPVALPAFRMDPNSRETTLINHWLPDTDLSLQVHGTKPIIAERSMYWGKGTALGEAMHASVGLEGPHMTFYLPDGQTSNGHETYTCVQNPNPGAVRVQVSYLPQGGGKTITFTDEIAKGSRKTYNMGDKIKSGRASIIVKSLDGARPIMVERSMYWNNRGAGTNTVGIYSD